MLSYGIYENVIIFLLIIARISKISEISWSENEFEYLCEHKVKKKTISRFIVTQLKSKTTLVNQEI